MGNKGLVGIGVIGFVVAAILILILASTLGVLLSVSSAVSRLEDSGYVVLAAGEYNSLITQLDRIEDDTSNIFQQISNETFIFPEETNAFITLAADDIANTFGDWTEIVDSNAVTLSSKFAAQSGHLAEIYTEAYSTNSERYMIEIAYGAAKTIVARSRVKSESLALSEWTYYLDLRSRAIPAGEMIYYRMACETADATLECSFRYYYVV